MDIRIFKSDRKLLSTTALALAVTLGLSACQTSEVFHNGYVVDQAALDLTLGLARARRRRASARVVGSVRSLVRTRVSRAWLS